MIEKLDFVNYRSRRWQFNTVDCPLHDFSISGDIKGGDREHMMDHGDWESFSYLGPTTVHIEGDLQYGTTEEYIEKRLLMLSIIIPPPGRQRIRSWGELQLQYTGQPLMVNTVKLEGYPEIPMQALYPSVTPFMISFKCFNPFWVVSGTGQRIPI